MTPHYMLALLTQEERDDLEYQLATLARDLEQAADELGALVARIERQG